ncbi:MAG: adenosine-specific kinase [candidate division Zixibacteria bacterium]|nr:adenosine-specific kinase [candidate division Zixibacteria bacterium]
MTDRRYKEHIIEVIVPEGLNVVFGMSHFIKTVEDLYETLVSSSTSLKFGIAFCEASQKRLVRSDGNDQEMIKLAEKAAFDVGCGHSFFIYMRDGFPINVLGRIKQVDEVCRIFCATANSLEVIVAATAQGRGVLGVIDGQIPLGIETDDDKKERVAFLRQIGYKRG